MRKVRIRNYIKFDGCLTRSTIAVKDRAHPDVVPYGTSSYYFFERQEYVAPNGEVLVGEPRNVSEDYYVGKIVTIAGIRRGEFGNERDIRNKLIDMVRNHIMVVQGTEPMLFHTFNKKVKIVSPRVSVG
jgi:hypothetical protein